jgi:hypothetical protein
MQGQPIKGEENLNEQLSIQAASRAGAALAEPSPRACRRRTQAAACTLKPILPELQSRHI